MNKSSIVAKGGLLTALSLLFIYLSTILPVNKLYLLGLSSAIIPISIILIDVKNSIIVYTASSILSLLLIGFKGNVIAYLFFFGIYGFVKLYIEKFNKLYIEIPLKLIFFNVAFAFIFILYKTFFVDLIKINVSLYIIVIFLQFVFIIYDYAFTAFIAYIYKYSSKR